MTILNLKFFLFSILVCGVFTAPSENGNSNKGDTLDFPADAIAGVSYGLPSELKDFPNRIVGGEESKPNEFPHQIALIRSGRFICGGSIINASWVLCAAHCTDQGAPSQYEVIAGEHNLNFNEGTEQKIPVSKIINHESYSSSTFRNDICLIQLASPLNLNSEVAAISLPSQGDDTSGNAWVTGWGSIQEGGFAQSILRKVEVPIITDNECKSSYGSSSIADHMICAGLPEGGKDACQGDSGGPMVSSDKGYLCGIVSWGYGCARPGFPGVYTEVSYFINWITENMK